jgi:transcriptional regulator of heat shock response
MTDRQEQILRSIVEQYAEIAAPVGSLLLAKLFGGETSGKFINGVLANIYKELENNKS